MWTLRQYENAAAKIGQQFVDSNGEEKINDMSTKVAQDAGLNPDGIRTLVRLANVCAFEKTFEKRAKEKSEDRMIEFEVGEPEAVINRLYKDAKEATSQEKTASEYNRQLDYFSDLPAEEREPLEKTASAIPGVEVQPPEERTYSPHEVKYAFERAEQRMKEQAKQSEFRWLDYVEKVSRSVCALDSSPEYRISFEKNAASLLGDGILPELTAVRMLNSPVGAGLVLFGGEKTASVVDNHIATISPDEKPIMDMVKEARKARIDVERCKAGIQWISEHIPGGN